MAALNYHGLIDGKDYDLTIGSTFLPNKQTEAYYTMRYDFKPASVDTSRPGEVVIGAKNECTVTIPNHDSGVTTYKGGKKPCLKECILIIDQQTGEIILERISSNIPLKKHRVDRSGDNTVKLAQVKPNSVSTNKPNKLSSTPSSKQQVTPPVSKSQINQPQSSQPTSNKQQTQQLVKPLNQTSVSKQVAGTLKSNPLIPQLLPSTANRSISMSSDSSSSSDSSDSESDDNKPNALDEFTMKPYQSLPANINSVSPNNSTGEKFMSTLQDDLELSDSNSDSD